MNQRAQGTHNAKSLLPGEIFDGRVFAAKRREELLEERKPLSAVSLGIVASSDDPVTNSFVRIKERNANALNVEQVRYEVPAGATTEAVIELVKDASKESGIIVQLPLPEGVDANEVINAIPEDKDVDALSENMVRRLQGGDMSVIPPVAAAVREILESEKITIYEKKVTVVGKGRLVGVPCSALFTHLGAQVTILEKNDDVAAHTKDADIVMLGAGSPHLLTEKMVKEGVVILDAGTSESKGAVVGDADPKVAEKAALFTPVPGGIGPVAVVEIFGNLFTLVKHS